MWKASAGHAVSITQDDAGADDWETDPDFVNDVSEKEQRWGAKTVQGSGHQEHINIHKLRENVFQEHQTLKEKELETGPKASHGYGGNLVWNKTEWISQLSATNISQNFPSTAHR